MAFQSNIPFERDGETFPLLGVSLITSPMFLYDKTEARVVLRLDPYRVDANGVIYRPMITVETEEGPVQVVDEAASRTVSWADAYTAAANDPLLAQALGGIGQALQIFISAKGL